MGNVNMESYQIHYKGEETAKTMFEKLDLIAQQVGDLPTFTSDDRAFLEKLPALPTVEGKTVLTAETDDQGETNLSYATPEVEGEDVAPEFSDAEAYSAGDLVFHDGILYRFTSDHSAGDWDATEATPTSVAGELSELKNTLSGLTTILVNDSFDVTGDGNVYKTFQKDLSKDGYDLISITFSPANLDFWVAGRLLTLNNKRQLRGDVYRKDSAAFSSTVTISYGAIYLKKI